MRIEILGYFGSGKTFLAKRLAATFLFDMALENHLEIPNWDANTLSGLNPSLSYELLFLFQHNQLLTNRFSSKFIVCDWSFITDRVWAKGRLTQQDFEKYHEIYVNSMLNYSDDVIYIYLNLGVDVILERLLIRGRKEELDLSAKQIEKSVLQLEETICSYEISNMILLNEGYEFDDVLKKINGRIQER